MAGLIVPSPEDLIREPEIDLIPIFIESTGRDPSGRIIEHSLSETHSWVKQVVQIFETLFTRDGASNVKDITGTLFSLRNGAGNPRLGVRVGTSSVVQGIIAGTGTTAVSRDDFQIETLIADGNGAGQLEYGESLTISRIAVSGGYRLTIARTLTNDSAGSITVNEIALYCESVAVATTENFMLIRDIISGGKVIGTGGATQEFKYHLDFIN